MKHLLLLTVLFSSLFISNLNAQSDSSEINHLTSNSWYFTGSLEDDYELIVLAFQNDSVNIGYLNLIEGAWESQSTYTIQSTAKYIEIKMENINDEGSTSYLYCKFNAELPDKLDVLISNRKRIKKNFNQKKKGCIHFTRFVE